MRKPYVKKLSDNSGFKVWIVDGKYIRDNIDIEFTTYGQHHVFGFIPEDEFWIDKDGKVSERKFYIDSMLSMNKLLSEGVGHEEAAKITNESEKAQRERSRVVQKHLSKNSSKGLVESVHKKLLKEYSTDKLKVWVVYGELVRGLFFPDFAQGGHGKVYPFIPENEVWIDDDVAEDEIKFVLIHELYEKRLIAKNIEYIKTSLRVKDAHFLTHEVESHLRHHPEEIDKRLKEEIEKTTGINRFK